MVKKRQIKPPRPWAGGGTGGPDVWRKLAEARLGFAAAKNDDLTTLGLAAMPADVSELKKAYRATMLQAHPDLGGSDLGAAKVSLAYGRLLATFKT